MANEITNLGLKIKEQRKKLGLSQFELAEMVDIHEKQVYRIEMGLNSPSITTVLKIIHVLNMDIRVLDINNLNNFNPVKDEIYSLLSSATDEELVLIKNLIITIRNSQRLTTKKKHEIKNSAIAKQKKLLAKGLSKDKN